MKVLVTGGAGYVGSGVVEALLRERLPVVVLDDLREGHRAAVPPSAQFVEGDYGDSNLLDSVIVEHEISAVMHMAGETLVTKSMTHPEDYFINNVANGLTLLEAMRRHGVKKIIFSSTAALFGTPEFVPITEAHPAKPINAYGQSKLMFEQMLDWYWRAHGINHICLRYFNAAGATGSCGEDHRIETHLIPIVLAVALGRREQVRIFGTDYDTEDGTCVRDYIHIEDIAQAHLLALQKMDDIGPNKLNLGNGLGSSVLKVIKAARAITHHPIPALESPRRPGDPAVLVASSELARELLGWQPAQPEIEQIVASAWAWHSAHPDGYGED